MITQKEIKQLIIENARKAGNKSQESQKKKYGKNYNKTLQMRFLGKDFKEE